MNRVISTIEVASGSTFATSRKINLILLAFAQIK
jgi:hypothetical protein